DRNIIAVSSVVFSSYPSGASWRRYSAAGQKSQGKFYFPFAICHLSFIERRLTNDKLENKERLHLGIFARTLMFFSALIRPPCHRPFLLALMQMRPDPGSWREERPRFRFKQRPERINSHGGAQWKTEQV